MAKKRMTKAQQDSKKRALRQVLGAELYAKVLESAERHYPKTQAKAAPNVLKTAEDPDKLAARLGREPGMAKSLSRRVFAMVSSVHMNVA